MATVNIELNHKPGKQGLHRVYLRLTQNGKLKRVKTEIEIKNSDFNKAAKYGRWIKSSNSRYKYLNDSLEQQISKLKDIIRKLDEASSGYNLHQVVGNYQKTGSNGKVKDDFIVYALNRADDLHTAGSVGTAKKYKTTISKLSVFLGRNEMSFHELTVELLNRFELHLRARGNSVNTISSNLRTIRAVVNLAIKEGYLPQEKYPFFNYRIKSAKVSKSKLSEDELHRIRNLQLEIGTKLWHVRNYFLFSFELAGIRISDVVQLKWKNVDNDRIRYIMYKTRNTKRKEMSPTISPEADAILDTYRCESVDNNEFIFPILNGGLNQNDPVALEKAIGSKSAIINKSLKTLSNKANIQKTVSFHTARHSFADLAKKSGLMNLYEISGALGHESLSVTESYLASLDQESGDQALARFYNRSKNTFTKL